MGRKARKARWSRNARQERSSAPASKAAVDPIDGDVETMKDTEDTSTPGDDGYVPDPSPTEEGGDETLFEDDTAAAGSTDTVSASRSAVTELEELREKLRLKQEQFLRLAADCENIKRRSRLTAERSQQEFKDKLFNRILPVVDAIDRARQAVRDGDDLEHLRDGLIQIGKLLDAALSDVGVKPMEVVGQPFDPQFHEAMMHAPSPGASPGTVTVELQKGFLIDDRVLRYARVGVAPDDPGVSERATCDDDEVDEENHDDRFDQDDDHDGDAR